MWDWLKTVWRARVWRDRAEEAEVRLDGYRKYTVSEKKRYRELCEQLLGVHLTPNYRDLGKEYALQMHFSEFEVRKAKGTLEEVVKRYGRFVRATFEGEMLKALGASARPDSARVDADSEAFACPNCKDKRTEIKDQVTTYKCAGCGREWVAKKL